MHWDNRFKDTSVVFNYFPALLLVLLCSHTPMHLSEPANLIQNFHWKPRLKNSQNDMTTSVCFVLRNVLCLLNCLHTVVHDEMMTTANWKRTNNLERSYVKPVRSQDADGNIRTVKSCFGRQEELRVGILLSVTQLLAWQEAPEPKLTHLQGLVKHEENTDGCVPRASWGVYATCKASHYLTHAYCIHKWSHIHTNPNVPVMSTRLLLY